MRGEMMTRCQKGFSLIEILVGVAIGLLAMAAIANIFAVSEGHKRTTMAGADAQTNGAIALYMIEREIRMSGWGMDTTPFLLDDVNATVVPGEGNIPCTTIFTYQKDGTNTAGPAPAGLSFVPIKITDGAGNTPDTVAITFFGRLGEETYAPPAQASLVQTMGSADSPLVVSSVYGCAADDMMIIKQPLNYGGKSGNNCTVMQISSIDAATGTLNHVAEYHSTGSSISYNPDASYIAANSWPTYAIATSAGSYGAGMVQCLGKPPATGGNPFTSHAYSILNAKLQLSINDAAAETVGSEVVDVQAQYGISPPGIGQVVNRWVDATVDPVDGVNWSNITTLTPTAAITLWSYTDNTNTIITQTKALTNDERYFRYKVHHTIVPLRNQKWSRL